MKMPGWFQRHPQMCGKPTKSDLARSLLTGTPELPTMANDAADTTRLYFLEPRQLEGPLVDHLDVWTRGGRRVGTFDGVVIDPSEHRARVTRCLRDA